MRLFMCAIVALFFGTVAGAEVSVEYHAETSSEILIVEKWKPVIGAGGGISVEVTLKNNYVNSIRMTNAYLVFEDALGQRVLSLNADTDELIEAGADFFDTYYTGHSHNRITRLNPEDVGAVIWVVGFVEVNGTVVRFDE